MNDTRIIKKACKRNAESPLQSRKKKSSTGSNTFSVSPQKKFVIRISKKLLGLACQRTPAHQRTPAYVEILESFEKLLEEDWKTNITLPENPFDHIYI